MLLRYICVSYNMDFFCRTNIKPRNALPVTLDCSQYGGSRFKKHRRCHGLCLQEVIARFVGSKTSDLIQRIGAYSLAPARVTSSVCLRVQGSRLDVFVR